MNGDQSWNQFRLYPVGGVLSEEEFKEIQGLLPHSIYFVKDPADYHADSPVVDEYRVFDKLLHDVDCLALCTPICRCEELIHTSQGDVLELGCWDGLLEEG